MPGSNVTRWGDPADLSGPCGQGETYAPRPPTVKSARHGEDRAVTRAWRAGACHSGTVPAAVRQSSTETLLSMLFPFWQLVIGVVVLVVCVAAALQLVRRGRSRMRFAVLVAGAAVVGVNAVALLLAR